MICQRDEKGRFKSQNHQLSDAGPSFLIALAITLCFFFLGPAPGDVNWPPWTYLSILGVVTLTMSLIFKSNLPASGVLLFMWILESSLLWCEWRPLTNGLPDRATHIAVCATATLQFFLFVTLFYTQWARIRKPVAIGLFWGGLFHAIFLLFDQIAPSLFVHLPEKLFITKGLLGNRSIGASFCACWWFFCMYLSINGTELETRLHTSPRLTRFIFITSWLAVPAVLISVSSISFGAMALGVCAVLMACMPKLTSRSRAYAFCLIFGVCLATLITGHMIDAEWGHHINRQDAWVMFWDFWKEQGFLLFGSGPGTFKLYGPMAQVKYGWTGGDIWLWAHSDWYQVLLELGEVGLLLAWAFYLQLLRKAFNRPLLFGSIACFGAIMCGNYPLHVAMPSLLGIWLVFESMWGDSGDNTI